MREIVHIQAGQCGNQIGAKVRKQSIPPLISLLITSNSYLILKPFLSIVNVTI